VRPVPDRTGLTFFIREDHMKSGQRNQGDAPNDRPRPQAAASQPKESIRNRQPDQTQPQPEPAAMSQADGEP